VRAAAGGTNAGMERRAVALLFPSLTEAAAQTGMLYCLNIIFWVGLQPSVSTGFPLAVAGLI